MQWLRSPAETAPRDAQDLAPIRIFTDEIELDGYVAPAGQRITDILLRGQDIAFLPSGADASPDNWILISPSEILLVAPPPLARRGRWPEPRDKRTVWLRVGDYRVCGTAHLAPGVDPETLGRRQSFLPLTDARVGDVRFAVVIVNLARAALERATATA